MKTPQRVRLVNRRGEQERKTLNSTPPSRGENKKKIGPGGGGTTQEFLKLPPIYLKGKREKTTCLKLGRGRREGGGETNGLS